MKEKNLFVSIAPYFFDESGHYEAYHTELHRAMRQFKYTPITYIPYRNVLQQLSPPQWVRFFSHSNQRYLRIFLRLFDYIRLIRTISSVNVSRRILFLESYSLLDLVTLALSFAICMNKPVELWHVYRDGLEHHPFKRQIHILISRFFTWKLKKSYLTFTDSEIIVRTLSPSLKSQLHVLPIPHTSGISKQPQSPLIFNSSTRRIRLWLPGQFRWDKGTKEIIKFCTSTDPNLKKFEFWVEKNIEISSISSEIVFKWTEKPLSREKYIQTLYHIDALLLPYRSDVYSSRTSGPFVEAVCAGKFVFTQKGNWLAYELEKFGLSQCVLDWNLAILPTKILLVINNADIQKQWRHFQKTYCSIHHPKNFANTLNKHL